MRLWFVLCSQVWPEAQQPGTPPAISSGRSVGSAGAGVAGDQGHGGHSRAAHAEVLVALVSHVLCRYMYVIHSDTV